MDYEKTLMFLMGERKLILKEILDLQFNPLSDNYLSDKERYTVLKKELSSIDSVLLETDTTNQTTITQ